MSIWGCASRNAAIAGGNHPALIAGTVQMSRRPPRRPRASRTVSAAPAKSRTTWLAGSTRARPALVRITPPGARSWGHRVERAGIPLVTFGKLHYRSSRDDTGFGDQRLPLHVRNGTGDWLTREAPRTGPWVAKFSLVTPHYPFTVPAEFVDLYPEAELPRPLRNSPDEWDRHPAVDFYRRSCGLDEPLTPRRCGAPLRTTSGWSASWTHSWGRGWTPWSAPARRSTRWSSTCPTTAS